MSDPKMTPFERTETRRDLLRKAGIAGAGAAVAASGMKLSASAQDGTPAAAAVAPGGNTPAGPQVEKLTLWTRASPDDVGSPNLFTQLQARAEAYTAAVGTQIDIQTVPDADFRPRMSAAAPGGEGPDIFGPCAHDWIGEFVIQGIALALPEGALENIDDFTPASRTLSSLNGQLYGAPMQVESVALYYNKALIPTPPTTWDELVQMAGSVRNGDVYGFGFDYMGQYYQAGFFQGFGGYVFGYDGTTFNTQDIGLNNAGSLEAVKFLRDMYWTQAPEMPDAVIDRANAGSVVDGMMETGQLAMQIGGPWRIQALTQGGIDFGVAVLPNLPNGQPIKPFVGVQSMLVNAYSEQQAAALDFINFMSGTDSQVALFAADRKAPARQSAQQAGEVASDPFVETWARQAEVGIPMPNIAQMGQVWTPWGGIMDAILPTNAPDDQIQPFLDQLVDQIKQAVAG